MPIELVAYAKAELHAFHWRATRQLLMTALEEELVLCASRAKLAAAEEQKTGSASYLPCFEVHSAEWLTIAAFVLPMLS